jgi:hypothetical protein
MALIIICVTGPAETGKSETIRQFTNRHLGYEREGDVRGVFPMPRRNYSVGVNGYGDNRALVRGGLEFLDRYRGLRIMIVASRTSGVTYQEVERFAQRVGTRPRRVYTRKIEGGRARQAAIEANIATIMRLMPGRER